jgi:hypothetical protein
MFSEIKAMVDVIRSAIESVGGFNDSKEKQNYSLELLRIYFLLMDVVKDGTDLLDSIDSEPLKVISSLEPEGSSLLFMLNQHTRCQDNILLTQKFRKFLKP